MNDQAEHDRLDAIAAERNQNDIDQAQRLLQEAREHYQAFQEALQGVGWIIQDIDEWLYHRVDAYPGWHGTRDAGAGQDMLGWMDEIDRYLAGEA